MTINYYIKNVYGNETLYVKGNHAEAIKMISGKQSLTMQVKRGLEKLGFEFVQVFE